MKTHTCALSWLLTTARKQTPALQVDTAAALGLGTDRRSSDEVRESRQAGRPELIASETPKLTIKACLRAATSSKLCASLGCQGTSRSVRSFEECQHLRVHSQHAKQPLWRQFTRLLLAQCPEKLRQSTGSRRPPQPLQLQSKDLRLSAIDKYVSTRQNCSWRLAMPKPTEALHCACCTTNQLAPLQSVQPRSVCANLQQELIQSRLCTNSCKTGASLFAPSSAWINAGLCASHWMLGLQTPSWARTRQCQIFSRERTWAEVHVLMFALAHAHVQEFTDLQGTAVARAQGQATGF